MTFEYIASSILCTVLALLLTVFATLNLFGSRFGKAGQKFIFEMDEVMGALLGIPHFSKLEGIILTLGAIGCYGAWSSDVTFQVLTVLGLALSIVYMAVCSAYAAVARQPWAPYLVVSSGMVAAAAWRAFRMMPESALPTIGRFIIGAAVLCVAATYQMRRRAALFEPRINKLIAIQAYVAACEDWDWREGESAPVGFEEPQSAAR